RRGPAVPAARARADANAHGAAARACKREERASARLPHRHRALGCGRGSPLLPDHDELVSSFTWRAPPRHLANRNARGSHAAGGIHNGRFSPDHAPHAIREAGADASSTPSVLADEESKDELSSEYVISCDTRTRVLLDCRTMPS